VGETVYILCAITSGACMGLLFLRYRKTKVPLLLWSSMAFFFFTLNNLLLFVDLVLTSRETDLSLGRTSLALAGVLVLLYGLIMKK
jgi:hypothetical protein